MGTNFYFFVKDNNLSKIPITSSGIHDYKSDGSWFHIAKTSAGWLPIFQAYDNIKSVKDLKAIYDSGCVEIFDEYEDKYTWNEFVDRVIKFNGGTSEKRNLIYNPQPQDKYYDANMPEYTPVSHFEYGNGMYADRFFKDEDGYEFTTDEFS